MPLKKILLFLLFLVSARLHAQLTLPYSVNFDSPADITGWSHYAITGTDDWQWGIPSGPVLDSAYSAPNVWGTNLGGNFTANSIMALETPSFDFTASPQYVLTFLHQYQTHNSNHGGNIEYSTNGGSTWTLLNGVSADKSNWCNAASISYLGGQAAWSGQFYTQFKYSAHLLNFLSGQPNVKFRFKFGGSVSPQDGWTIDNFAIVPNTKNVIAHPGDTIRCSKYSPIKVNTTLGYLAIIPLAYTNLTNYYLSTDNVLDAGDPLIGTKTASVNGTTAYNATLPVVPGLHVGTYYVFYRHDVSNALPETDETDNVNYAVMVIDTTYEMPLRYDFETGWQGWKTGGTVTWQNHPGVHHHAEGVHAGTNALSINEGVSGNSYVESPYMDLTTASNVIVNFWHNSRNAIDVKYSINDGLNWFTLTTVSPVWAPWGIDDWDFYSYPLTSISTNKNVKLRLYGWNNAVDEIYLGTSKPDLDLDKDRLNRYTPTNMTSDTLLYSLINSGPVTAPSTTTKFYWSVDSLLDGSDLLLGSVTEASFSGRVGKSFVYTKPTTAPGIYYLLCELDAGHVVDEMREANNLHPFTLYQQVPKTIPYFNDFETQVDGWRHNASIGTDDWTWGTPVGKTFIDTVFSGTKAWVTKDSGNVSAQSRMHLYSPVFDFSAAVHPVLEFDLDAKFIPGSITTAGSAGNLSYSIDGGATWVVVDTTSQSFKGFPYHYQYDAYGGRDRIWITTYTQEMFAYDEKAFPYYNLYQSRDSDDFTSCIMDLGFLAGKPKVQFRYNVVTNLSNNDGMLFDDFHIRETYIDLTVEYKKALMTSSHTNQLEFFIDVKNQGNYIAPPTTTKFYLSTDSILGVGDYFLGQDVTTQKIRPDFSNYSNLFFPAPANLGTYHYLLFEVDATNVVTESNEANNFGWWPLALDSIHTYPYLQDFNDTIVNGWNHYATNVSLGHLNGNCYRMRNMLLPGEPGYQMDMESGVMFTDWVDPGASWIPTYYLESPSFDFTYASNIQLSFRLMSVGQSFQNGSNLEYSLDGGDTWQLLTADMGPATGWYNATVMYQIANEPGWNGSTLYDSAVLAPRSIDLSALGGETDVIFRFKHRSNYAPWGSGTVMGMRLDDFKISANVCLPSAPMVLNPVICQGETYFAGGAPRSVSGIYHDTLTNICGGDSVVTTNLTVTPVNTTTSFAVATLTANASMASYQWIDCTTLLPIAGETNQDFTATVDGTYAVSITQSGCTDTSACFTVCLPRASTTNVTICQGESYYAGGAWQTTSGTYTDHLFSICGGDSLATINLSVTPLDLNTYFTGTFLTVDASPATYQWIDCNTMTAVAGETNQNFTPPANGSYAVEVNNSGCIDTSACVPVCFTSDSIINVTICQGESYYAGGALQLYSGVYTDLLTNICGGDSTITTNLTVTPVNINAYFTGSILFVDATPALYQWLDCADMSPLPGATSQSATPPGNGNFAVQVTQDGCTDTSSCVSVISLGLENLNSGYAFTVSPNPFTEQTMISVLGPSTDATALKIRITDAVGRTVNSTSHQEKNIFVVERGGLSPGLYFVQVLSGDQLLGLLRVVLE